MGSRVVDERHCAFVAWARRFKPLERGLDPDAAIREVRRVRPGAIETFGQESYVRGLTNGPGRRVEGEGASHAG